MWPYSYAISRYSIYSQTKQLLKVSFSHYIHIIPFTMKGIHLILIRQTIHYETVFQSGKNKFH